MITKIILSASLFVLVFVSGIWISRLGKPYQTAIFTLHKLISLAAILFAILAVLAFNKQVGLSQMQLILAISVAVLLLITIVSGGILSAKEELNKVIQIMHKLLPALSVIGLIILFTSILKAG